MLNKIGEKITENKRRLIILIVAVFAILISLFFLLRNKTEEDETVSISPACISSALESDNYAVYRDLFDTYKEINPDVKAILYSPSVLIQDEVIVQSSLDYPDSSLEYLHKQWRDGSYSKWGTCFIDGRNNINQKGTYLDQNVIVYGHTFTIEANKVYGAYFTDFTKLMDEENYEDNKYFVMVYENEAVVYEVASVYYTYLSLTGNKTYDTPSSETIPYYYINYTSEMFENYVKLIKENQFYDTGVELTEDDKLLTLCTCTKSGSEGNRLIVLCKAVKTIDIR